MRRRATGVARPQRKTTLSTRRTRTWNRTLRPLRGIELGTGLLHVAIMAVDVLRLIEKPVGRAVVVVRDRSPRLHHQLVDTAIVEAALLGVGELGACLLHAAIARIDLRRLVEQPGRPAEVAAPDRGSRIGNQRFDVPVVTVGALLRLAQVAVPR